MGEGVCYQVIKLSSYQVFKLQVAGCRFVDGRAVDAERIQRLGLGLGLRLRLGTEGLCLGFRAIRVHSCPFVVKVAV